MKASYFYESPIGRFGLQETDGVLTRIWVGTNTPPPPEEGEERETALLREAHAQIAAYFNRKLRRFDLPFRACGTPFQQNVWKALEDIPYGTTITYGELARRIGNPKACRAVGGANGRNPIPILIPCHRVIGNGGMLTGYTGGLHIKTTLLLTEGILP